MDTVKSIIGYFHSDDRYNRTTFGLDQVKGGVHFIRWRVTDAILVVVELFLYQIVYYGQPFQRQFYVGDLTISHPFAEVERVSNGQLFLYAVWIPLCTIGVVALVMTHPKNKVYVTYVALLGAVISVLTTSIITDVLKNAFGRLRPDFLARCIPKEGTPTDVLVYAKDVCTTTNFSRLMDGFRTTPLGHSSISFAGLLYLSYFLAGQLAVTRREAGAWRSLVTFAPTLGAAMIALSRTEDYRHHFVDVFVGLCLGALIALWLYFRLFRGLGHAKCYKPRMIEEDEDEYEPMEELELV